MRDSTICEDESHKIVCDRETQKLSDVEDRPSEETFTINTIIFSSSCVSHVNQVHEEDDMVNYDQPPMFDEEDQEMATNNDMLHNFSMFKKSDDYCTFLEPSLVSSIPTQIDDNGKSSEMQSMMHTQLSQLKGNENISDLNSLDKVISKFDNIPAIVLAERSKKSCAA